MKKIKFPVILLCSTLLITATTSCKKKVVGPQGPAGETGIAGSNGVNGNNGVANIVSKMITVRPDNWQFDTVYNQWYYEYALNTKFSENTILVSSIKTNNGYQSLPYEDLLNNIKFNISDHSYLETPTIEFQLINNSSSSNERPVNDYQFKISLIEVN